MGEETLSRPLKNVPLNEIIHELMVRNEISIDLDRCIYCFSPLSSEPILDSVIKCEKGHTHKVILTYMLDNDYL